MDPRHLHMAGAPPDSRMMQNQPTSTADSASDELMAEADEPPDERSDRFDANESLEHVPDFKKLPCELLRRESLLTQTLHTSEDESTEEEANTAAGLITSSRAHSSASTWSHGSALSMGELTSDGHTSRTGTPSPPLPPTRFQGLPQMFNEKSFQRPGTVRIASDAGDPLRKPTQPALPASNNNEAAVEQGLGRKRCIMFACGGKTTPKAPEPAPIVEAASKPDEEKRKDEAGPRKCAIRFACTARPTATPSINKLSIRTGSPPPKKMPVSPRATRSRANDASPRLDSPKSVRKVPSVLKARRSSIDSQLPVSEATRFHEFASSEEERDDWTDERTCHRSRLTVEDTLKVENNLRKLGEEAEDEELEDEEAAEEMQAVEDDDDEELDEDDDDDDSRSLVDSTGYVSDEGFQTDDEEGFANSDDESNAGSDYEWWAPGTGSREQVEHIRPLGRRTRSSSSIGSFSSTRVYPSKTPRIIKRSKTNPIEFRPRTPELPDSTDFVCGTLDEDRPLEEAWISCREQRRAAKHQPRPQDIDPTFPTSDPEMDEEDEDGYDEPLHMSESDTHDHHFLIHGHPEQMSDIDGRETSKSIVSKKRSPIHSPKRTRSPPPPAKRAVHHSPPPRRLFGHSPKRVRSPAPTRPLRSPPPSRRSSVIDKTPQPHDYRVATIALGERPQHGRVASSLPRNGPYPNQSRSYFNNSDNSDDGEETQTDALPTRSAIDIVKGLEKKRQRRKEKLFEKHCRLRSKNKNVKQHVVLPGIGAEKMRQMGEGLSALRGKKTGYAVFGDNDEQGTHILSY